MSNSGETTNQAVDTLRISDAALKTLLKRLEAGGESPGANLREDERLAYHAQHGLIVRVHHPGGFTANFIVHPRNISRTGMGFLHGSFLYSDTPCSITLMTTDGHPLRANGKVVRCRHVTGNVHDIGLKFDEPIDLEAVVKLSTTAEQAPPKESDSPKFSGRVLFIDDSEDDREFAKYQLGNLGVEAAAAGNVTEATEQIGKGGFDLVLSDVELGDVKNGEIVEALRKGEYKGPIAAVTADESELAAKAAKDAGFAGVLVKPFTEEKLAELLGSHLPTVTRRKEDGPLLSSQWSNEKMRPLILNFLGRLDEQMKKIHEAISALANGGEPDAAVLKCLLDLKGTAGNFGYPQISAVAQELHQLATSKGEVTKIKQQFADLNTLVTAACEVKKQTAKKK